MQPAFFLALAALEFFGHCTFADRTMQRPNILFILSDDQDLLMNSMDFMPIVNDELGRNGLTFQKHYCTSALCCPSRASLLTGKCVHNTNVTYNKLPWGAYPKFVSEGLNDKYLPIWLQEEGINTYYVGKFFNGYDIKNYQTVPARGWTGSNFLLAPGIYDYLNTIWALNNGPWKSYPGENAIDITTRNALKMLDTAVNDGKSFFLTIAPAVPHMGKDVITKKSFFPIPQPRWANAFPDAKVPRTPNWNPSRASGASWLLNLPYQSKPTVNRLDKLYRARIRCVAGLDNMVGELISSLKKHGILNNTHIIYTTDNGYHIGQHRMGGGKKTGYETDINIPLLWRGPGVPAGKVINEASTHTDLVPTLLTLFGLPLRTGLDGQPIPIIVNQTSQTSGEHVNVEFWGAANTHEGPFKKIKVAGLHNNTYKALRIVAAHYSIYYSVWCTNEHELYDMSKDEYQMDNLLADTLDINNIQDKILAGRPLKQVVARLDALLMVLKSCAGTVCTLPWLQLHPQGNVKTLQEALNPKYDQFYQGQPKVAFSACKLGYIVEYEGPQSVKKMVTPTTTSLEPGTTVLKVFEAAPIGSPLAEQFARITGYAGSIVDANALATTIAVNCLPDAIDCQVKEPFTVTEGPSTYYQSAVASTEYSGAEAWITILDNCQISNKTHVTCTNSVGVRVSEGGKSTVTNTKVTATYAAQKISYTPLTVTAGVSKLHRPKATQTPAGAAGRAGIGGAAVAAAAGAVAGFL